MDKDIYNHIVLSYYRLGLVNLVVSLGGCPIKVFTNGSVSQFITYKKNIKRET